MRILLPFLFAVAALPAQIHAAEVVPTPAFRSIDLRGGGDVTIVRGPVQRVTILSGSSQFTHIYLAKEGQLRIDACNSRCPRNYPLQIRIESPTVPSVAISGGGTISAAGGFAPQSRLAAAIQGGGRIDLRNVDAGNVAAAIHGGGQILVRPRSSLEAAVNGGGEIRYSGNPAVTMAVNGGGSVSRAN
jgi:hypothetical protein